MSDFTVTIHGPRGEEWERICGRRTFPVILPAIMASLPGVGPKCVYLLDLKALPPDDLNKIVEHLAAKFSLKPEEAADEIEKAGIPILDEDVSLMIRNPQRWI